MKTYKGLTTDYFTRNRKLEKIHDKNTDRFMDYPTDLFMKVLNDVSDARADNSELFDYLMKRAYPRI